MGFSKHGRFLITLLTFVGAVVAFVLAIDAAEHSPLDDPLAMLTPQR